MENNQKEIDLLTLLVKGYRFTIRNIWVFVIALSIGCGISLYKYLNASSRYSITATLSANYVDQDVVKVIIENIPDKTANTEGSNTEKAKLFNLTPEQWIRLQEVHYECIYLDEAKEEKAPYFKLTVTSENPGLLDTLMNGVIYYINNHPYVSDRFQVNAKGLDMRMAKLQSEYQELDSLQLMYTSLISEGRYVPVVGNNDKSVYSELVNLYNQWVGLYQAKKLITQPLVIIDKQTEISAVQVSFIWLLVWPVGMLILSVVFVLLVVLHRKAYR